MVDAHGIMVKNAMLINGDYHRMHASIQSLIIDMFKKAKLMNRKACFMALSQQRFSKNIEYCIIPDIMTNDYPHRERSERVIL